MSKTDTSEKGLETLIMRHLTGVDGLASNAVPGIAQPTTPYGGTGWFAGSPASYDREFAVDTEQLFSFLRATQPDEFAKLGIGDTRDSKDIARQKFLARLQGEITRRGVIDVLRKGIKHGPLSFDLFYGTPSAANAKAVARHATNRFSITRQLHYSRDQGKRSLDLCAFINGLPVITFELKNSLTKQTVDDAVAGSIQRAIEYFFAFRDYLAELKSPYQAIVAFSGEPEYKGEKVSEAKLNGFPSNDLADRIQEDPYRFLICADKFQTGYDEPLLHTMYVDKALSGIKAVQTLSRLNRAHPKKSDVFVLDFQNDTETIEKSFADYYRTTILSSETDPDKQIGRAHV